MFLSGANQSSFFNASVHVSDSKIFLILAYALGLPSNDGQERKNLAPRGA